MEPEFVFPVDNEKYVYAVCKCSLPVGMYGIKLPRVEGQNRYPFKCDKCGTEGEVITKCGDEALM